MKAPRTPGALSIGDRLHSALALCRLKHRIGGDPVLELEAVGAVETEIGSRLSNELWAWFAALGRDPRQICHHTADAREEHRLPRRFIAFECDQDNDVYLCMLRDTPDSARRGVWEWDGRQAIEQWHDMSSFVREFHGLPRLASASDLPGYEIERMAFQPTIIVTPSLVPMRRACHAKFGDGVILREIQGPVPKLEIDFGGVGRKLVLASFVHEYDDRFAPPVVELLNAPGPSAPPRVPAGRRPRGARRRRGSVRTAA